MGYWPRSLGTLIVAISSVVCVSSQAFEAAIRAPLLACPLSGKTCSDDILMPEILQRWEAQQKAHAKCLAEKAERGRDPNPKKELIPPRDCSLQPALFWHLCSEASPRSYYYSWAPVTAFPGGEKIAKNVIDLVSTGKVVNGKSVLVETSNSKSDEQHIALCSVRKAGGASGPPVDCATVAVRTPTALWIRAGSGGMCFASASFRENGAIRIDFDVSTKKKVTEFSERLKNKLVSDLDLNVELTETVDSSGEASSVAVLSVAPLRDSKIIKGWRESFAFDVNFYVRDGLLRISGGAQPLICQQALGNIRDYHGLDDAQRGVYATALNDLVEQSVASVCSNFKKKDAKQLSCD